MKPTLIALFAALLFAGTAYADSDEEKKTRGEHRGPPPVALEACANSVQGDPCSFEGRRGEALEGTCEAPDEKPLACRPEGAPPPGQSEKNWKSE